MVEAWDILLLALMFILHTMNVVLEEMAKEYVGVQILMKSM